MVSMVIETLTAFISPFLPYLLKLGGKGTEKAVETIGGKYGEIAWAKAQKIWTHLSPKVETKEAAKEAVADVVNNPEDKDSQIVLKKQLGKLLEQDEELARLIAQILQEDAPNGTDGISIVQNTAGNQNQIIGHVSGGTVVGPVIGSTEM